MIMVRDMYGIQNQAFDWVRAYLIVRLQRVKIKETLSDMQVLGIPHICS